MLKFKTQIEVKSRKNLTLREKKKKKPTIKVASKMPVRKESG